MNDGLREQIRTLLDCGERAIVLDLARVDEVDAAGVGELVHLYNLAAGANSSLRIANPIEKVRHLLTRVGLLDLLIEEP
jgi:anti-sigma B factor antagonist